MSSSLTASLSDRTAPRVTAGRSIWIDLREMAQELRDYRELLHRIVERDLALRYKQTVMGFGWAVSMPLVNTAVFWVIFTRVAPIDPGPPYPLFAFCGLLVWNWFASSLRFAVTSLTSNATLVTKVYFPREILPLSAVIVSFVDFAVASTVLVAMMAFYRVEIGWPLLLLPALVLLQAIFTTAVALLLSMANLFYRDVKYLFEVLISTWMFATSVLYPVSSIGGVAGTLLALNPVTHLIDAYRAVVLNAQMPAAGPLAALATGAVVLLIVSWVIFHRAEFKFAETV